ncbi:hypothetical protein [Piscinibacter sakaiensis]|uniref:hypothetical protein n=1 Tax=Piscinibacter sakaiensis TaxID=1547922 RepID=UPI003AAB4E2C
MSRIIQTTLIAGSVAAVAIYAFVAKNSDPGEWVQIAARQDIAERLPPSIPVPALEPSIETSPRAAATIEERRLDRQSIGAALTAIEPPAKPFPDILAAFRNAALPSDEAKLQLLSALSYCSNARHSAEIARNQRAAGNTAGQDELMIESLDKQHIAQARYCFSVSQADYLIRLQILQTAAEAGNKDAMLFFYEVGPAGTWDEAEVNARGEDRLAAWHATAAAFLRTAAQADKASARTTDALNTLVLLFRTPECCVDPQDGTADPFARQRDDAKAYAYALAWAELLRLRHPKRYEFYIEQTLRPIAKNISSADQETAARRARELLQQFGANP